MPAIGANIDFDFGDFDKLHHVAPEKGEKAVKQTTYLVEGAAVKYAPDATSNMINMIGVEFRGHGYETEGRVISHAPYSWFVHEGTGIFGPTGMPIFPTEKQALWWPGAAHPVKMVKGQKPQPFLYDALQDKGPLLYQKVFG